MTRTPPGASLSELLADPAAHAACFPYAGIHLGHCAVAPLCGPAAEALCRYALLCSRGRQDDPDLWHEAMSTRSVVGQALKVDPSCIALVGPTTYGLSLIAQGLPWQAGDEVICCADDYPANVYPWLALREQGVMVHCLRPQVAGCVTWNDLAPLLGPRTRLVSLASCHYLTGFCPDITGIGQQLRQRGILFCLDAIQTLGILPCDLTTVDFMAADSHKWLMGPSGAGILYVAAEHHDRLRPLSLGVGSVKAPDLLAQETIVYEAGARRYEGGTPNVPGILAMGAAWRLWQRLGPAAITARVHQLRHALATALAAGGWQAPAFPSKTEHPATAGILSLRHPDISPAQAQAALHAAGIVTSVRRDHSGTQWWRLAPHAYHHDDLAEQVVRAMAAVG